MPAYVAPYVYDDSASPLGDHAVAVGRTIAVELGGELYPLATALVGDAPELTDHAQGGADTLSGTGGLASGTVVGDALTITGNAQGGNDQVLALGRSDAHAYGDALTISGHGSGGDDSVTAGSQFGSFAYGDAALLTDHARGGNDTVTGTNDIFVSPMLFGDADTLQGHAHGGNDLLFPVSITPGLLTMYGDARVMADFAVGGDDTLVGGQGADRMWGDAAVVGPHVTTGADLFVFSPANGHDEIMDFQPGKDRIELADLGFSSFQDLASHIQATPDGALISLDATDDILLRGVTPSQLTAHDFLLV